MRRAVYFPMGTLSYTMSTSLDGYIEDTDGKFDWARPDEEVHAFANDLERDLGTHLYGRRMYEVMSVWQSPEMAAHEHPVMRDYAAIWQATDKVVFSRTLETADTARTRIERAFDPDAVRQLKASAGHDLTVGGPHLAAEALKAGLVDECQLFLAPIVVGGGNQALPDHVRLPLELLDERRFASGMVYLRYRTRSGEGR
jgi:dihydrofolate reductase